MQFGKIVLLLFLGSQAVMVHPAKLHADDIQNKDSIASNVGLAEQGDSSKVRAIYNILLKRDTSFSVLKAYADSAYTLSKSSAYYGGISNTQFARAIVYEHYGYYDSAMIFAKSAIHWAIRNKDGVMEARALSELANLYLSSGNTAMYLESLLKAIEIYRKLDDKVGFGRSYNRLGYFYTEENNPEKALSYFEDALQIFDGMGKEGLKEKANVLNNMGIVYFNNKDYAKAIEYYNSSATILLNVDQKARLSYRLTNMAKVYLAQDRLSKADSVLELALENAQSVQSVMGTTYALLYKGELHSKKRETTKAIAYLRDAAAMAESIMAKKVLMEVHEKLSLVYASIHDFQKAYASNLKLGALKDSLHADTRVRAIAFMQTEYETRIKEDRIVQLEQESKKKAIMLTMVVSAMLLLFIIFLLLMSNYKRKQKTTQLINEKNEALHRQKVAELLKGQQIKSIQDRLEGQEIERKRLAKELHDGIGGTLAGIKLNLVSIMDREKEPIANMSKIIKTIDEACEEIRAVSHNLSLPTLMDSAFTDVIENFVLKLFEPKNIEVNIEVFPKEQLNTLPDSMHIDIYRIIQELSTNILKHAHATSVEIYLTMHQFYINLIVEDNGKGFDPEQVGNGIGLRNIHERVGSLKGNLSFDTKEGRGTTVIIDIPLEVFEKADD